MTELPEFKIKRHARARHLRVRVYLDHIDVLVPARCAQREVKQFIDQSMDWIVSTWQQKKQHMLSQAQRPSCLLLFNSELPIQVHYQAQKKLFVFSEQAHTVYLNEEHATLGLVHFILAYAKQHLPHVLQQMSQQIGIEYQHSQIRFAKSRWGSCNTQHKIMLNAALVLVPMTLVRYVCIHELAHVKHFNHSAQFWSLVGTFDHEFMQHKQQLQQFEWPYWLLTQLNYV